MKNELKYGVRGSKFENDFHVKLRNHMCVYSSSSYFHTFMGRKLEIIVNQPADSQYKHYLELEANFIGLIPNFIAPYKIVIFNKRGHDPSIAE